VYICNSYIRLGFAVNILFLYLAGRSKEEGGKRSCRSFETRTGATRGKEATTKA